jgi:hypothetical protein
MQTEIEEQNKDRVLKTLAVGGFVGLIIIIAWLGIQLISFMPSALSSLASLADSVYNYEPVELVVVSTKNIANAGEAFALSWNIPEPEGTFQFSYACTEGVAIDIRTKSGDIKSIPCATTYELATVNGIDLSITSEKNRFTDIPYTISFVPTNQNQVIVASKESITVVNASISTILPEVVATTTPPVVIVPNPTPKPVVTIPKPPPTTPVTPTTPKPVTVPTYTYAIPVSNPRGYTDLGIKSLGAGTIDVNNRFINTGVIDNDTKAAVLFEIKNTGTKTSNPFTFTITLPSGSTYTSGEQLALKPNERTVITLGFEATNLVGVKPFKGFVTISGNTNSQNDAFAAAVTLID